MHVALDFSGLMWSKVSNLVKVQVQLSSRMSLLMRFRRVYSPLLVIALFASVLASCGTSPQVTASAPTPISAWPASNPVLVFGYPSEGPRFLNLLRSAGYVGYMGSTSDLGAYRNLVVLNDSLLDSSQITEVENWTAKGGRLVLLSPGMDRSFKLSLSSTPIGVTSASDPNLSVPVNFQGELTAFTGRNSSVSIVTANTDAKRAITNNGE